MKYLLFIVSFVLLLAPPSVGISYHYYHSSSSNACYAWSHRSRSARTCPTSAAPITLLTYRCSTLQLISWPCLPEGRKVFS
jgi:hypothetical protein